MKNFERSITLHGKEYNLDYLVSVERIQGKDFGSHFNGKTNRGLPIYPEIFYDYFIFTNGAYEMVPYMALKDDSSISKEAYKEMVDNRDYWRKELYEAEDKIDHLNWTLDNLNKENAKNSEQLKLKNEEVVSLLLEDDYSYNKIWKLQHELAYSRSVAADIQKELDETVKNYEDEILELMQWHREDLEELCNFSEERDGELRKEIEELENTLDEAVHLLKALVRIM